MALGARRTDVIVSVVRRGLVLAALGIGLGLLAAVPLMRWRDDLLFEIRPTDPWTFGAAAALMAAVAVLASYLPARRAAQVSPVEALRAE
jgi:putative ABC transport system permease protein